MFSNNLKYKVTITAAFLIAVFFSFYKLTESPRVWLDEGCITQISRNIAYFGKGLLQVAPGEFTPVGAVTTSYPVTYPIALIFKLFGVGVLQARLVMVFYILSFFLVFYFLIKKKGMGVVCYSLLLLVSFAPIFGNGKNVLGEIPGLTFLGLFLLFIDKAFLGIKRSNFVIAGLFFGLCVVTKPIFLVLIPAFLFTLYLYRKEVIKSLSIDGGNALSFIIPALLTFLIWVYIQFYGESIAHILSFYYNPYALNLKEIIYSNLIRFARELQPMYFLAMMIIWSMSIIVRRREKTLSDFGEITAFIFSLLIFAAYLRTPGYYRYFFPGEVLALVYLPNSLYILFKGNIKRFIISSILILLVLFQLYQTLFNSWVASYYSSTATAELEAYFKNINRNEEILIYNAAEILLFLPHNNYRQYFSAGGGVSVGDENLNLLRNGLIKKIIATEGFWDWDTDYAKNYVITDRVNKYIILQPINK